MFIPSCGPLAAGALRIPHSPSCCTTAALRPFVRVLRGRPLSIQAVRAQRRRLPGAQRLRCSAAEPSHPSGQPEPLSSNHRRVFQPEDALYPCDPAEQPLQREQRLDGGRQPWWSSLPQLLGAVAISLIATARFAHSAHARDRCVVLTLPAFCPSPPAAACAAHSLLAQERSPHSSAMLIYAQEAFRLVVHSMSHLDLLESSVYEWEQLPLLPCGACKGHAMAADVARLPVPLATVYFAC